MIVSGEPGAGKSAMTAQQSTPYLNSGYFDFVFGNTANGERVIDCQDWRQSGVLVRGPGSRNNFV